MNTVPSATVTGFRPRRDLVPLLDRLDHPLTSLTSLTSLVEWVRAR
jgi:hypothetical protein